MNIEALKQAATDRRLSHGSVRLLLFMATTPQKVSSQEMARRIGAINVIPFKNQLQDFGYLKPSPQGMKGRL
jgi:hypothetical protein